MTLSTVLPSFPAWIAAVLCVVILCGAVMCGMGADAARDTVEQIEHTAEVNTSFMMNMRTRSAQLVNKVSDYNIRAELQNFADNVRFSDPVSNDGTESADRDFEGAVKALETAIRNNGDDIVSLCRTAQIAFDDRNTAAKMSKRG